MGGLAVFSDCALVGSPFVPDLVRFADQSLMIVSTRWVIAAKAANKKGRRAPFHFELSIRLKRWWMPTDSRAYSACHARFRSSSTNSTRRTALRFENDVVTSETCLPPPTDQFAG